LQPGRSTDTLDPRGSLDRRSHGGGREGGQSLGARSVARKEGCMPETNFPPDVPFSLLCESCDGGMEISSYEEAIAAGWTEICYAPDLSLANFLGLCPECRRAQEEEERARSNRSLPND